MPMVSAETYQAHGALKAISYTRFSKSTAYPHSSIPTKTVLLVLNRKKITIKCRHESLDPGGISA